MLLFHLSFNAARDDRGMMPADKVGKIKDKVTASRTKLLAEVEGLQGAQWDWRPDQDRWSARQTLAHVSSAEWSHLEVAYSIISGTPIDLPGFELDSWNVAEVAKREGLSPEQILADLRRAHEETLTFLEGLDADKLALTGMHPALGEVSIGQVLRIIALHDGLHRRDIVRLRAEMREADKPTWPVRVSSW